jgi:hypothetical protein
LFVFKNNLALLVWWHTLAIPALGRLRHEDQHILHSEVLSQKNKIIII